MTRLAGRVLEEDPAVVSEELLRVSDRELIVLLVEPDVAALVVEVNLLRLPQTLSPPPGHTTLQSGAVPAFDLTCSASNSTSSPRWHSEGALELEYSRWLCRRELGISIERTPFAQLAAAFGATAVVVGRTKGACGTWRDGDAAD